MNIKMPMMKMAKMVMMIIMMPMPIVRMTKMVMMVVENNHDENNVGGNDIMMMIQLEKSIFHIFSFLIFQLHSWSVQNYGQFWQEVNNNIYHHHLQHQSHPKSAQLLFLVLSSLHVKLMSELFSSPIIITWCFYGLDTPMCFFSPHPHSLTWPGVELHRRDLVQSCREAGRPKCSHGQVLIYVTTLQGIFRESSGSHMRPQCRL